LCCSDRGWGVNGEGGAVWGAKARRKAGSTSRAKSAERAVQQRSVKPILTKICTVHNARLTAETPDVKAAPTMEG